MTKLPVDERRRMTLEDYILFFTTRTGHGVNIDHLNQILFMHGFVKHHHSNKHVIVERLNSFDLLRPRRSTVSINAVAPPPGAASASAAALSTEDVARDIEGLGWRECPVGALLSVRAGMAAAASSPVPLATIRPGSATVERVSPPSILSASSPLPLAAPAVAVSGKRAPRGQGKAGMSRRKRRMMQLLALPSLEVEDMATAA